MSPNLIRQTGLSFLFLFFSLPCIAEDSLRYHLRQYDNSSGLPQNSVNDIASDKDGYLWLATEDGLVRFDGSRFVTFGMGDMPIATSRFYQFYKNEQGELIAINGKEQFVRITNRRGWLDTIAMDHARNNITWSYVEDRQNGKQTTTYFHNLPEEKQRLGGYYNEMVLYTGKNDSYICKPDHVQRVRGGKVAYSIPFQGERRWGFILISNELYYIYEDGRVTCFGAAVVQASLQGDIVKDPAYATAGRKMEIFWNFDNVPYAIIYFNHSFYIGKPDGGGGLITKLIFAGFDIVSHEVRRAFYNEEEDKLYLGSSTRGLYVLSRKQFVTRTASQGRNSFYAQLPYGEDGVLTSVGDILRLTGKPSKSAALLKIIIADPFSMFSDSKGNIWFKQGVELFKLQAGTLSILAQWKLPDVISMLYDGGDGKVWIGMANGDGIYLLDMEHNNAVPEHAFPVKETITYFARETNDIMCVGTDKGLYKLHISTGKMDAVEGLKGIYVRSLTVTKPDEVWVTTYGLGFYLYRGNVLTAFPPDQDEYINTAHCIVPDNKGFFWITTNKGLFQVMKKDLLAYADDHRYPLYYHYYDREDGFNSNEFNGGCQPCALWLKNGYVSLPSLNGMVFFNPDTVSAFLPGRALRIDKISLDKKMLPVEAAISLPRQFGTLHIAFSSPYMGNKKNLQISYALVQFGQDTIWLPLPADGSVSISTLPSGNYTLIARKLNGFGKDNFSECQVRLHVPAAWYETVWFYIVCVLLMMGGSFFFIRLRTRYTVQRNIILEKAVAAKTQELTQRTEIQERIIRSVSHNVLTPLQYQQMLSGKIYEAVKQKEDLQITPVVKVMNEHSSYLYHMVANLLKYLKGQMAYRPEGVTSFQLSAVVKDIIQIFEHIAGDKGTVIYNYVQPELMLKADEQLLSVILYNLVDNAVKVTRRGSIIIAAEAVDGKVRISVADSGPGVPEHIQRSFNHAAITDNDMKTGSGIGLIIVKELAISQGMEVKVMADEDKGTVFTITC